jgi:chemotaxis protein methyltransferase WspC
MASIDFENLLKETMGLDSASVGSATIESAVRLRMDSLGLKDTDVYLETLRATNDELQELIEAVVVPETWFFRDPDAFTVLTRLILEEWLPNHAGAPLRLLSVPCCTGEEPYSTVMALLDAGLSREKIKVDAVDISVRALIRARRGIYGSNSFRGDNLVFRDRYFKQAKNGYSLMDGFRDIVSFHHGNLLSSDFRVGSMPYDVIFCRNVLIYFNRDTQERVMKILGRLLTPSGFLFVGPAEAFLAASSGFKSINQSMCFAFRKASAIQTEPVIAFPPRLATAAKSSHAPKSRHTVKARVLSTHPLTPIISVAIDLSRAKQLGDVGKFTEAVDLCEAHLKEQGPTSEAYRLLGLLRDAMGDLPRAAECYRKVLYLDPNHSETLLHLALLSEKQGDIAGAQRLRERARRAEKGAQK